MKPILCFLVFINQANAFKSFNPNEIIDNGKLAKDATEIISNIGLNCATDPRSYPTFINEFWRLMRGIGSLSSEASLLLSSKKDFPNLCHVLTQSHINTYSEGKEVTNEKKCIASVSIPFSKKKKCVKHKYVTKERPKPSYYWPFYFIEVTENGNDSHYSFAKNNPLLRTNRSIAERLSNQLDERGAIKLTQLVMGTGKALNAVGMKTGSPSLSDLMANDVLTFFEKRRVRGSKNPDRRSFDATIWPVALGESFARHFSVCGPIRERRGQRAGGYSWAMRGVPMTCPVSSSVDVYPYWDTGMIDYLDPEALSSMAIGSNPVTCGSAIGAAKLSGLGASSGSKVGDKSILDKILGKFPKKQAGALKSCSFPIMGSASAIAKQAVNLTNTAKWKQSKCTLWGSVAPRMSTSVYETDYSFANTALKFKLFSHDFFGVPRGKHERWSLAYPWEDNSNNFSDGYGNYFNKLNSYLSKLGISKSNESNNARSYSLFSVGSPYLVNASYSPKHIENLTKNFSKQGKYLALNGADPTGAMLSASEYKRTREAREKAYSEHFNGDRRIYTVFEKIDCTYPVTRVTTKIKYAPTVRKYDSCESAIRLEVYKYIQTKLLRKICNAFGETEGKPWKK